MDYVIVITTLSDDLNIINKISSNLINNHLVASSHISKIESSYWWNNRINNGIEYKLELRTIISLYDQIEKIIKKIYNYELPEISYYKINGSKEIIKWVYENVSGGK